MDTYYTYLDMITARILSEEVKAIVLHEINTKYDAMEEIRVMELANEAMAKGDIELYNKLMARLPEVADVPMFKGVY